MWLRVVYVCCLLAVVETAHGLLRVRFLNRRLGDHRARQVAVFTGSALILAVAWVTLPWIGPTDARAALGVGALWAAGMLAFEVALGRFVFRLPWSRVAADFDLRQGGLLGLGFVVLTAAPWLVGRARGWF
jgi:hypothetical protein